MLKRSASATSGWRHSARSGAFVRVPPSAKGLGASSALLSFVEERAGVIADAEDLHPDAVLTLTHWAKDADAAPVLESAGFNANKVFIENGRDHGRQIVASLSAPAGNRGV